MNDENVHSTYKYTYNGYTIHMNIKYDRYNKNILLFTIISLSLTFKIN